MDELIVKGDGVIPQCVIGILESLNAKWKADILTKSAGANLGTILRVDDNWNEHYVCSDTEMRGAEDMFCISEAAPMTMDIEPEDIKVTDALLHKYRTYRQRKDTLNSEMWFV